MAVSDLVEEAKNPLANVRNATLLCPSVHPEHLRAQFRLSGRNRERNFSNLIS